MESSFLSHAKTPRFQGIINPPYPVQLSNDDGSLIDFTGCNLTTDFTILLQNVTMDAGFQPDANFGQVVACTGDWEAVSLSKGQFRFWWGLDDLNVVGDYFVWITALVPGESAPRAFDNNKLTILTWNGESIVTTHVDVDATVLAPNAAQEAGGNLATTATKLTAILAALQGQLNVLLENGNGPISLSNPLAIDWSQLGEVAPYGSNPSGTTANTSTPYMWGTNGTTVVRVFAIGNETGEDLYYRTRNPSNAITTGNGMKIKDGTVVYVAQKTDVLYFIGANSHNFNAQGAIKVWGFA